MKRTTSRTPRMRFLRKPNPGLLLILLLASLAMITVTCDNFVLYEELNAAAGAATDEGQGGSDDTDDGGGDGTAPPALAISPVSAVIVKNATIDFEGTGGEPDYIFSIASGDGSIEADTGIYTAPDAAGSAVVQVTDASGSTAEASVTILDSGGGSTLQISPVSVSVETDQTIDFAASGGDPEYVFSVVGGGGSIEADTGLYTAPATAGSATVRVEDSEGAFADAEVTIIDAAPPPLAIVPATAAVKITQTIAFAASGGQGGYVFSVNSGGGVVDPVSGLYTAPATAGGATVRVTDAGGATADATVNILVPAELRIFPETVTLNYGGTYTFVATGGTTPYTFGLQNNQSGASMAGADYTAGNNQGTDIVRVEDVGGSQAFASINVVPTGVLVINPTNPRVEEGGTLQFSGAGGTPPYEFSIVSGSGSILTTTGEYTASTTVGIDVSEVEITDDASDSETTLVDVVPKAPTNLIADGSAGGPQTIELTWTDNSASEDGYRIERRTNVGAYAQIDDVAADSTSYTDNGLSPNTLYIYRVYAYTNDPLQSDYSNEGFDLPN